MTTQEQIEAINFEQLATATDRVLLAARFGRARPSTAQLAPDSQRASFARGSSARIDTAPRANPWRTFATTALVTSLVSVGTAIACLL